jgi:predicted transposase/invertase (TIGR01784 family)
VAHYNGALRCLPKNSYRRGVVGLSMASSVVWWHNRSQQCLPTRDQPATNPSSSQSATMQYEHAFVIANRASLSPEELELQERREMFIQDQRGALEKATIDGEALGIKKGMEKGIEQGAHMKALAIAQNLKSLGLGNEQIAQATGLGLAEVAAL